MGKNNLLEEQKFITWKGRITETIFSSRIKEMRFRAQGLGQGLFVAKNILIGIDVAE